MTIAVLDDYIDVCRIDDEKDVGYGSGSAKVV